jgi:hypothetical protein
MEGLARGTLEEGGREVCLSGGKAADGQVESRQPANIGDPFVAREAGIGGELEGTIARR